MSAITIDNSGFEISLKAISDGGLLDLPLFEKMEILNEEVSKNELSVSQYYTFLYRRRSGYFCH
jgi:hypothetical protein